MTDELSAGDAAKRLEAVKLLGRLFGQAGGAAVAAEWADVLNELLRRFKDEKVCLWGLGMTCVWRAGVCMPWVEAWHACHSLHAARLPPGMRSSLRHSLLCCANARQPEVRLEMIGIAPRLLGSMPTPDARERVLDGMFGRVMDADEKVRRRLVSNPFVCSCWSHGGRLCVSVWGIAAGVGPSTRL